MRPDLRVLNRLFLDGCSGGLDERTAIIELTVSGDTAMSADRQIRFRSAAGALRPGSLETALDDTDWPGTFVSGTAAGDAPATLGSWIVGITVAIQRWGGDAVRRGRVLLEEPDRVRLAIPWQRRGFFSDALEVALTLVTRWLDSGPPPTDPLERYFDGRWNAHRSGGLATGTFRFIDSATARGIPSVVMPGFAQIGWGAHAERIDLALTGHTSWLATSLSRNKLKLLRTLDAAAVPIQPVRFVTTAEQVEHAAAELGWPVVVTPYQRPRDGEVFVAVSDTAALRQAFESAAARTPGKVIVKKHVPGDRYRMLVVGGRTLLAVRMAADAVADIDRISDIDAGSVSPDQGVTEPGTSALDVAGNVHPVNSALVRRAVRVVGLDISCVDLISTDIGRPWSEVGAVISDVDAQPALAPFWRAAPGRDLEGEILEILLAGRNPRIPSAAIADTDDGTGAASAAAMLHRIWAAAGVRSGGCAGRGAQIGENAPDGYGGPALTGASTPLTDPDVEAAVFTLTPDSLARFGHPCDRYDAVAILHGPAEACARASGAIVVNADEARCMAMLSEAATSRHILVNCEPSDPAAAEHRRRGGRVVHLDHRGQQRWIILACGSQETALMPLGAVAELAGPAPCRTVDVLAAAALAWALGVDIPAIRVGLGGPAQRLESHPHPR